MPRFTSLFLFGFVLACSSATPEGRSAAANGSNGGSSATAGAGAAAQSGSGGSSATAGASAAANGGNGDSSATAGASATGGGAGASVVGCDSAALDWKTANKTWYESYPDPGSDECVKYNGCEWAGQFAACDGKKPEEWVRQRNIAAAFPGFQSLALHDLCLKSGDQSIVVTVLDTCGDSDCDGCCTQNRGSADALIDLEKYTNERWGVDDGPILWADLGPTRGSGCD